MNNFPAMNFPLGARGNNFDSQIKRIPFASNGVFCACTYFVLLIMYILFWAYQINALLLLVNKRMIIQNRIRIN